MNDWLLHWGIAHWKPALQLLVLPPLPLLLLALLAAWMAPRAPRRARALGLLAVLGLWLLATPWAGHGLVAALTRPPPPLAPAAIAALQAAPHTALVVLGAGRKTLAPEYGEADLRPMTLERLRYGWWLARRTGLPLAYTGGVGHAAAAGVTEAQAVRLATARDGGVPLRWAEERARDTNENALYTVAMLQAEGITRLVVVTHHFHQQRSLAAFARAVARSGRPMQLVAAPMGQSQPLSGALGDYLPGLEGLALVRYALHEWLGWLAGA